MPTFCDAKRCSNYTYKVKLFAWIFIILRYYTFTHNSKTSRAHMHHMTQCDARTQRVHSLWPMALYFIMSANNKNVLVTLKLACMLLHGRRLLVNCLDLWIANSLAVSHTRDKSVWKVAYTDHALFLLALVCDVCEGVVCV